MEEDSTASFLEHVLKDDIEKRLIQLIDDDPAKYDEILEELLPLIGAVKK
jgi:Mn-dependent DtxR family transcriptional regulator